jgi:hemoglobin-like flavoprotein
MIQRIRFFNPANQKAGLQQKFLAGAAHVNNHEALEGVVEPIAQKVVPL